MHLSTSKPRLLNFRHIFAFFLIALIFCSIIGTITRDDDALAAPASTINFQARLMNAAGSIAQDGNYNIEFKLYNTESTGGTAQGVCSGNCLWIETRTGGDTVRVANGYVTVNLGSENPFGSSIDWDQELWLTMRVGGTGAPSWDTEMSPRLKLTAVPYAFSAGKMVTDVGGSTGVLQFAGTLNQDSTITLPDPGVSGAATVCYQNSTACGFVTGGSTNFIQNGTSVQTAANFNIRSAGTSSVGAVIQGANGQTANLFNVQTWDGATATTVFGIENDGDLSVQSVSVASGKSLTVTGGPTSLTGISAGSSTAVSVVAGAATNKGITIQGAGSQSANLLELQDSSANVNAAFNATGNQLTLGRIASIGTVTQGKLVLSDGTTSNLSGTIQVGAQLTTGITYNLPVNATATQTICTTVSSSCSGTYQPAGNYANQQLSNLSGTVAINISLLSGSSTIDLGSGANPFRDLYLGGTATNNFRFTGTAGGARTITLDDLSGRLALVQTAGSSSAQTGDINASGTIIAGTALQGTLVKSADGTGASSGITLRSGNATSSGNTGDVTISSGTAASGNSGSILIDSGGASGTKGAVTIGSNNAGTISLGNAAISKTINIGSVGSTAGNSTINIGTTSANVTQAIVIGASAAGGANAASNTLVLDAGTAANAIQIGNSDQAHGIQIGTGAAVQTVAIGSTNSTSSLSLQAGTGNLNIGNDSVAKTTTINIGNNNTGADIIALGSSHASSTTSIQGGTGASAVGVQAGSGGTISIGTATNNIVAIGTGAVAGTITIGGTGTTGNIVIGQANGANTNTISIGSNIGNTGIQTISIGTSATGGSTTNVTIGSTIAGTTTLQSVGGVRITTVGAATANAVALCRDSSTTNLIACDSGAGGPAFLQGGNSFGATGVLGTRDANNLQIVTGSSGPNVRATFDQSNNLYLGNGITHATPNNFAVRGTGSTTAGTAGATLTLQGGAGASTTTGSAGGNILIAGGDAGGSGNNAGGIVTLQGGLDTNTGTPGKVLVKNAADSATAFQVQNTAGSSTVLDVDTSNGRVGIGTAAPARTFDVVVNTSTINAPPIRLHQAGSGDASIELSSASTGNSIYLGLDASNSGAFTIGSSTAASSVATPTHVQSVGVLNGTGNFIPNIAQAMASTSAGNLIVAAVSWDTNGGSSLTMTCSDTQSNSYTNLTLYHDAGHNQALQLCYATNTAGGANTVTATFGGSSVRFVKLTASEFSGVAAASPVDASTGQAATGTTGTDAITSGLATTTNSGDLIFGAVVNTTDFSSITAGTGFTQRLILPAAGVDKEIQIQSLVQSSAGPIASTHTFNQADDYVAAMVAFKAAPTGMTDTNTDALFTLTQTGAAKFKNNDNSSSAFLIQNASGLNLMQLDTINNVLHLGATGATAIASTVNIATSTAGIQTVTIGAANANASTTLIQGGNSNTAGSEAIRLIPNVSGGILLGASTGTGTITVGRSTATNTISIGSGDPDASATQTINIGNGLQSTASSSIVINILSGAAGSNGTATLNLGNSDRVTGINIGNVAADAARTINLGSGSNTVGVDTINIGTGNTSVVGGKAINIGTGTPSGSGSNVISIGSTALASSTTLQAGTGNLVINTGGTVRATFEAGNNVYLGNGITAGTPNSFAVRGTGSTTAGTAGANLTIQGGAGASATTGSAGGNVLIAGGTAAGSGNNAGGSITLQGGLDSNSGAPGTVLVKNAADSATAFQIQTAASAVLFTADTAAATPVIKIGTVATPSLSTATLFVTTAEATTTLRIGDATNGVEFSAATGPTYRGTGRPSQRVTLVPEYAGGTMSADGTANSGSMTSDFCSSASRKIINTTFCGGANDEHTYYRWNSTSGTNDYDIYIRYQMPSDYTRNSGNTSSITAINMFGWRTAASNLVDLAMFNAAGDQCGTTTNVATGTAAWTETPLANIAGDVHCDAIVANDVIIFRVKLTSISASDYALAGAIRFNYLAGF